LVNKKKIDVNKIKGKGDWIEIKLLDENGEAVAEADYIVQLSDGSEIEGKLDENGYARVGNIFGDSCFVKFPDYENIQEQDENE
jgi:hypothetical protein